MDELSQNSEKTTDSKKQMTTSVDEAGVQAAFERTIDGDPLIGQLYARKYRIVSRLGQGGMSAVYKATDVMLNRVVALKILLPGSALDVNGILRFNREARAASHLSNPHIITIYEFTVPPEGQPYLVMDYVDGPTLADLIAEQGPLEVVRGVTLFKQICSGLMHAHEKGVIHRDLKPSNIMITKNSFGEDFVSIVDFGIAKLMLDEADVQLHLTQTGEVFGSPYYMSPEQCKGEQLDARSDIYSLGCLMYEALSGRVPFHASNIVQTIYKHVNTEPEPFSTVCPQRQVPDALAGIVFKSLAKSPGDRYQSIFELYADLKMLKEPPRPGSEITGPLPVTPEPAASQPSASLPTASLPTASQSITAQSTTPLPTASLPAQPAAPQPGLETTASQPTTPVPPLETTASQPTTPPPPLETTASQPTTPPPPLETTAAPVLPVVPQTTVSQPGRVSHATSHTLMVVGVWSAFAIAPPAIWLAFTDSGGVTVANSLIGSGSAGTALAPAAADWYKQQHKYEAAGMIYTMLGDACLKQHDKPRAQKFFEESIESLRCLAATYNQSNRPADVTRVVDQMLAVATRTPGPGAAAQVDSLVRLATTLRTEKRYALAASLCQSALLIIEKSPQMQYEPIARCLDELTSCYISQTPPQYSQMEKDFSETTLRLQKRFGDSPVLATSIYAQAKAANGEGKHEDAVRLDKQALDLFLATLGTHAGRVADTLVDLGTEYVHLGMHGDAKYCYSHALQIYREHADQTKIVTTQQALAKLSGSNDISTTVNHPSLTAAESASASGSGAAKGVSGTTNGGSTPGSRGARQHESRASQRTERPHPSLLKKAMQFLKKL